MKTIDVLNHVKNISESESINLINTRLKNTESFISLGFLNQHGFNLLADDTSVQKLFFDLDILLRDGIGIKIANKMSNIENNENLNGTDLIPKVISYLNTDINDFYVFGTEPPWLEEGSLNLLGDEKAAYLIDGFQKLEHYLDFLKQHINTKKNAVIILAMGMPKQEELAFNIKREIKGKGIIICGGAIVDFKAGRVKRAPNFIQRLNLEWLYRLIKEPRRLFKRYVIGIPLFFYNLIKYK